MVCMVWNSRSLCNKYREIMEHIVDFGADIIFLTETWLKADKSKITADIKDYGYELKHSVRQDSSKSKGGGVGLLHKSGI